MSGAQQCPSEEEKVSQSGTFLAARLVPAQSFDPRQEAKTPVRPQPGSGNRFFTRQTSKPKLLDLTKPIWDQNSKEKKNSGGQNLPRNQVKQVKSSSASTVKSRVVLSTNAVPPPPPFMASLLSSHVKSPSKSDPTSLELAKDIPVLDLTQEDEAAENDPVLPHQVGFKVIYNPVLLFSKHLFLSLCRTMVTRVTSTRLSRY